jgi:hypothetical protein
MQETIKTHQVVGAKLKYNLYNQFEIRCLEKQIPMSKVIKDAIYEFLSKEDTTHTYNYRGYIIQIETRDNQPHSVFFTAETNYKLGLNIDSCHFDEKENDFHFEYTHSSFFYIIGVDTETIFGILRYACDIIDEQKTATENKKLIKVK